MGWDKNVILDLLHNVSELWKYMIIALVLIKISKENERQKHKIINKSVVEWAYILGAESRNRSANKTL